MPSAAIFIAFVLRPITSWDDAHAHVMSSSCAASTTQLHAHNPPGPNDPTSRQHCCLLHNPPPYLGLRRCHGLTPRLLFV
ncbi:hypothetical protein J3E72DRAFT_26065 [Bipolaris maydis]|nr:hypothetical protein J3E74DRAFT_44516 [Bipolaris maydis]KAJ6202173.1 hypothetical protein J3E72DRAFT_26065 [Bipolaris maydis]KAJ6210821.1 hypothetical protein PSV09DRAFT_2030483 [Bipolaris maydis]